MEFKIFGGDIGERFHREGRRALPVPGLKPDRTTARRVGLAGGVGTWLVSGNAEPNCFVGRFCDEIAASL